METDFKNSVDPSKVAETAPKLSGIEAWFDKYGKPRPRPDGYVSEFIDNPKVYGGTEHYPAFKSLSSSMKRGRAM